MGDECCMLVRVVAYMLCFQKRENGRFIEQAAVKSRLVYDGAVFRVAFYVAPGGAAPAEYGLNSFLLEISRSLLRCLRAGEIRGRFRMNASSNI